MTIDNAYHPGELEIQARAGVTRAARAVSAGIRNHLPAGALGFVGEQTMAVFGSLDTEGNVWASVVFGKPGFLCAENDRSLRLHRSICYSAPGDPLWTNLAADARLGILLIELATRRRLRVNGKLVRGREGDYSIEVERAYGNCPKYIQRRRVELADPVESGRPAAFRSGERLEITQQAWIAAADTFFVASANPAQGVDASHRGGHRGFVKVLNPRRLRIPDYSGNNMFNTLGNFASYPRAGLVFIDFERGRMLQLGGRPELIWDTPDETGETGGTARYWEFEVVTWLESELPLQIDWQFLDYSPYNPGLQEHEAQN